MSDFKNFMRLYSNISCIHYSRVFELMKLYNSDKDKYKTQFSRVLSCLSIWENRNARIKELQNWIADLISGKRGACFTCEPVALLNKELEEREKKLIECVRFYADKNFTIETSNFRQPVELDFSDFGKFARQTLKELGINNE